MSDLDQQHEVMRAAERALRDSPTHHLAFAVRQSIWKALEPPGSGSGVSGFMSFGQARRFGLAKLCVLHVCGSATELAVTKAYTIFRAIDGFFDGNVSSDDLHNQIGILTCESDNLSLKKREADSLFVAALAKVACVALHDELMGDVEIDPTREEPLDPYDWDAALLALGAYSNGFPWHRDSELPKRIEYWDWYIHVGVPQAAVFSR